MMPAFPITTTAGGICFAFPDVCLTPAPPAPPVPVPYPNIGQLSDALQASDVGGPPVTVGGNGVVLVDTTTIPTTTGDEAGNAPGGVISGVFAQQVDFPQGSSTVTIHGQAVVRMFDPTEQNAGNANGVVLGGVPNVLVGG